MTSIGSGAFKDADIVSVVIPSTVKRIGAYAFSGSAVKYIKAEDYDEEFHILPSIVAIGEGAFMDCANLSSFIIGNNAIAPKTYAGTMISEIVLPASVTALSADMFAGCKDVKSVRAYASVPLTIAEDVFEPEVYAEATLLVPDNHLDAYKADSVWGKFTNIATTDSPVNLGDEFCYNGIYYKVTSVDSGNLTVEVQPASWDDIQWPEGWYDKYSHANGVKYQGELIVPETVPFKNSEFTPTSVADNAFVGIHNIWDENWNTVALTIVTLPATIKKVGQYGLCGCPHLTRIPDDLEEVGKQAFESAIIEEAYFPSGLKKVGERGFYHATFRDPVSLDLSELTSAGDMCFGGLSTLYVVKVGNKIEGNLSKVFPYNNNLKTIEFSEDIEEIPNSYCKGLSSVESIVLNENIHTIGNEAFANCKSLKYINYIETPDIVNIDGPQKLPANIKKLGDYTFECVLFHLLAGLKLLNILELGINWIQNTIYWMLQ